MVGQLAPSTMAMYARDRPTSTSQRAGRSTADHPSKQRPPRVGADVLDREPDSTEVSRYVYTVRGKNDTTYRVSHKAHRLIGEWLAAWQDNLF